MIQEAIARVVDRQDLTEGAMQAAMEEIMSGQATSSQIASLITGLRMKGETVEEITAAAQVMRRKATLIPWKAEGAGSAGERPEGGQEILLDTCGTGGDQTHTFNISTAAAFVVAGAGVPVAKHGNRSVSSSCGSADVCEALGLNLQIPPAKIADCIRKHGLGFLYAPSLHPAMKHAVTARREIGIRTIFNALGPLANPAGATAQLVGVYRRDLTRMLAEALHRLGCRRAMVVHGSDGMDEITTTGETYFCELRTGDFREGTMHPEDFGVPLARGEDLLGGTAQENAKLILEILGGQPGPRRNVVLLNAGAALYTAGAARDLPEGIEMARRSIDEGKAMATLRKVARHTQTLPE